VAYDRDGYTQGLGYVRAGLRQRSISVLRRLPLRSCGMQRCMRKLVTLQTRYHKTRANQRDEGR
jgi:hypothetical protein